MGQRVLPTQPIEYTEKSQGESHGVDFNIGIFADTPMGGYARSATRSASVSYSVPNWKVSTIPGDRDITYNWSVNDPVTWETIKANDIGPSGSQDEKDAAGASWDLPDINRVGFHPGSLTTWTGKATYGPLALTSATTVHLVDRFSYHSKDKRGAKEAFWITSLPFGDDPNSADVSSPDAVGAGMNLCRPRPRRTQLRRRGHSPLRRRPIHAAEAEMSAATVPPSDTREAPRWPWCTLRPGTLGRVRAHVDTMALAGDLPSPVHSAPAPGSIPRGGDMPPTRSRRKRSRTSWTPSPTSSITCTATARDRS